MTKAQIEQMQEQIESVLKREVDHTYHLDVMHKLQQISTLMGSGSTCIAESKRILLTTRGKWLRLHKKEFEGMKPSQAKEFVITSCIDEEILYVRCERNYSALTHAGEMLRSILSMIKQDMASLANQ
jgi:hypothetical protein